MKRNKFNISLLLQHSLFVMSLLTIAFLFDPRPEFVKRIDLLPQQYHFIKMIILLLGCFYLNMFFLVPKILTKSGWIAYVFTILAIAIVVILISYTLMDFPEESGRRIIAPPVVLFLLMVTFSVSTSIKLNSDRIKQERIRSAQENESLKSELTLLRSQITPHFMFNVLNTLASLARQKSDEMEDVIIRISHLMRYMLYNNPEQKITLTREIEFLKSYIEIQKLRFGELDVTMNVSIDRPDLSIEPMLLIPLLENAFKHGTGSVKITKIELKLVVEGDQLKFNVVNRFNPDTIANARSSGIGLQNVRKRLTYLYEDKHRLNTFSEDDFFHADLSLEL